MTEKGYQRKCPLPYLPFLPVSPEALVPERCRHATDLPSSPPSHHRPPFPTSLSSHPSILPEPWCGIQIGADGSAMVHAFPLQNTKQWGEESCVKEKKMTCGTRRHGWIDQSRHTEGGGFERGRCAAAREVDTSFEKPW